MKKAVLTLPVAAALGTANSHATRYVLSGSMDPIQATTNPGNVGNGSGSISGADLLLPSSPSARC